MNKTPETDDLARGNHVVQTEWAEQLERERDDALEKIKELIYIADRAIDLADINFENDKFGVVSELRSDLEKIKKQNYHSDKMSSFVSESSK